MEHNTFAGSSSPPSSRLAQAFDSGNRDTIYTAVRQHAESLLRHAGRDYTEGHVNAKDLAQQIAVKILRKLTEGAFSGTGTAFASWVKKITWSKRQDYYRAANRRRRTTVPLTVTVEGDDGAEEIENREVSRAASRSRGHFLPADTSGFDPAILQVFCDEVRRIRYTGQRALPVFSATDAAIVEALLDGDNYAEVAAKVGRTAKQVENRLNTIRRRERRNREQAISATPAHLRRK